MKIALLDFHRKSNNKIIETYKIRDSLTVNDSVKIDIFEMLGNKVPEVTLEDYQGLVLSGADSSHVERYPGYRISKNLLEQAKKVNMPILGICAGHQIIARMYGFSLELMENGPEMGWYEISLTEEGKSDPLFKDIPETFASFLCHIKRVNMNSHNSGVILGNNSNSLQAYKYEDVIYGIQFHPEDTIASGEVLIQKYKRRPPTTRNAVPTPAALPVFRIFKNFIGIVEARANSKL